MTAMRGTLAAATAVAAVALSTLAVAPTSAAASGTATTATAGTAVAGYLTTANLSRALSPLPLRHFATAPAPVGASTITVDPSTTGQTLTAGFGVAMTQTSAYLLARTLSPATRAKVLDALFSPTKGIGLTFLRIPIAGSDYVLNSTSYSYDDMPAGQTDPALAHFSTARDQAFVFPMIRAALARQPRMTVMANPWSPPAWMKADDRFISQGPQGTLLPQYYGVYAQYIVRALADYRKAGIPVGFVGVQNEPYTPLLIVSGIPNSFLTGADEGRLITQYVVPALASAGLRPGILAYDDGYERSETFIPAAMAIAGSHIAGFAYHCYVSDPQSMAVEGAAFPGKVQLETECASKLSNIDPQQMAIRNLRQGAQGIQLWNAVLDSRGGPKIGSGCKGLSGTGPYAGQDCIAPVTVNQATGRYRFTTDYWALAHFSAFIRPGAVRLGSTSASCPTSPSPTSITCGVEDVAFRDTDGTQVLVVTAHDGAAHTLAVTENGVTFTAKLPDGGTETFVWTPGTTKPAAPPAVAGSPVVTVSTSSSGAGRSLPSTGLGDLPPLIAIAVLTSAVALRRTHRARSLT